MLALAPTTHIWVAITPVDFRRGIDGVAQQVRACLEQDPMSGAMFVFRNRSCTAIKVLVYDGQGFWLCHKRFSSHRLRWWPTERQPAVSLAARELQVLIWNGKPDQAAMAEDWRKVSYVGGDCPIDPNVF